MSLEDKQQAMRAEQKRRDRQQRLREKEQRLKERALRLREREQGLDPAPQPQPLQPVEETEPQPGGRKRSKSLPNQLQDALADAEALQHQKNRGEQSYISQCKLVSNRLAAIQKLMSRRENSALEELKEENVRLKQKVAALELEVETAKQRVEPVAPVAPADNMDPVVEKMLADAAALRQKKKESAPVESPVTPVTPVTPAIQVTPTKGDSVDPELLRRNLPRVQLFPPRDDVPQLSDTLARPRPVITPAETEQKAIAAMGSQFQVTDERLARLEAESRKNAPKPLFEPSGLGLTVQELAQMQEENAKLLEKLRAQAAAATDITDIK